MAYHLAGKAPAAKSSASASTVRRVRLDKDKDSELRIEVGETPLHLRLLHGTAEIFGTELPPDLWLTFPPHLKFAVFTWYNATIEIDGATETAYTADEAPMVSYVNVNAMLEEWRKRAKDSVSKGFNDYQGPRVIIVGPSDSGKSTLSMMLLSWAAKLGWKPTFVDLDIGEGSITIPGCIAATPIKLPIDPMEGIHNDVPLAYFFGHTNPSKNVDLYKGLVKELAQMQGRHFAGDVEAQAAGMVINTMVSTEDEGYELLLHAINTFNANVVLVLDQDKLFSNLRNIYGNRPNVDVVKLQKSGGVVSRNEEFRKKARSKSIRKYFYGLTNDLVPRSMIANFSGLHVYRIGGEQQAPSSALPIGADPVANSLRIVPVDIGLHLIHRVLAVSHAKQADQIASSNVAGFIFITDVEISKKRITFLAPSAEELPSKCLIMGTLIWNDE